MYESIWIPLGRIYSNTDLLTFCSFIFKILYFHSLMVNLPIFIESCFLMKWFHWSENSPRVKARIIRFTWLIYLYRVKKRAIKYSKIPQKVSRVNFEIQEKISNQRWSFPLLRWWCCVWWYNILHFFWSFIGICSSWTRNIFNAIILGNFSFRW